MTTTLPAADLLVTLQIRLSPDLLDRIDSYCRRSSLRPTRSQAIRFLLLNAMNILEESAP